MAKDLFREEALADESDSMPHGREKLVSTTDAGPSPAAVGEGPKASPRLVGFAVLLFFLSVIVMASGRPLFAVPGLLVSASLGCVGAVQCLRRLAVVTGPPPNLHRTASSEVVLLLLGACGGLAMTVWGAVLVLAWLTPLTLVRGRQIRRLGRVRLAPIEAGGLWGAGSLRADVDEAALRPALAEQWRANGRTEHASVAAFTQLATELLSLGAPPALVASAHRDALDEIRHAELCFSLARALDGRSASPGGFLEAKNVSWLPVPRRLALARLAVRSLVDGALSEGISARIAAALARRCDEPTIRAVLREIAADEGRHAAHGWDVLRWCLSAGGHSVASALRGGIRTLPTVLTSSRPAAARDGAWERYGIAGRELESAAFRSARADVVRRVDEFVATRPRAGGGVAA